ncbi:MAG TPA: YihY/virulence factor BrkB family protein, partial [Gemmatimonadales bacterium]|nr:YihY/virulence factor BrkB family protein [Gemmatimonadales bacterium]
FLRRTLQAADENNIPFLASALTFDALLAAVPFVLLVLIGLTHVAQAIAGGPEVDPNALFHRFFPPHTSEPGRDPFGLVERVLVGVARNRGTISLYAIPAFVWFSTRLFAGVRTSLNDIYDVSARPSPPRNFVLTWLAGKVRDALMVVATVVLFLANTALSTVITIAWARGEARVIPQLAFFFSTLGRLWGEVLAFVFSISLFYVTYRYASVRRLPWRTALLASTFTALLFEVAKRLYGLYLAHFASVGSAAGDANIGAAVLFVLWIYYTAIVFLLGGVVAETWELRRMQDRQRTILG